MGMEVKQDLKSLTKGTLWSVIVTLVSVLLLALIVSLSGMSGGIITFISQAIKVVAIFFGVRIALRHVEKRGWLFGAIMGIIYTVLTYFIFAIIGGDFDITTGILVEMLFSLAIGVISAILIRIGRRREAI